MRRAAGRRVVFGRAAKKIKSSGVGNPSVSWHRFGFLLCARARHVACLSRNVGKKPWVLSSAGPLPR